jgi:deaminated glutathione amidase
MGETMRAGVVQLNSNDDKNRNLASADTLVRGAAADGARLVVLPEKFNFLGKPESMPEAAEGLDGPTLRWASDLARELDIWLVAGSIVERVEGEEKLRNTSALISPDGELRAAYRKIHMFDVEVAGTTYRESDTESPGDEIVTGEIDELVLGLAICYDLRFPEVFRILALRGALAVALPSAFTLHTGKDHWAVLVRARAIENQVFMIAAGQIGRHPPDHESYGRSMIVDPWGTTLVVAADEETFAVADLDLSRQRRIREKLPSLANRVPDAYRWPAGLEAVAR